MAARQDPTTPQGHPGMQIVRDLSPMLLSGDPIDAELAASHLLVPGWEQVLLEDPDAANELPHPAVPTLGVLRNLPLDGPGDLADAALALAYGFMWSDPKHEQLQEIGTQVADELRAAGAADPAWVLEPPTYEPAWAVVMRDAWTYLTRTIVAFRNQAGEEHGIVVEVSRLHGYQILEIDAIRDPRALADHVRREDGPISEDPMLVVEDVPLVQAAGLIKGGLEGTFNHHGSVALLERNHEHGADDVARLDLLLRRYVLLEPIAVADWEAANAHPFLTELDSLDADAQRARLSDIVPDTPAGAWLVDRIQQASWPIALFGPAEVDTAFDVHAHAGAEHGTREQLVEAMHAWLDATSELVSIPDAAIEELRARIDAERVEA